MRYLNRDTGETARFPLMSRDDAMEVARQLVCDGEWQVQIEDETGEVCPPSRADG